MTSKAADQKQVQTLRPYQWIGMVMVYLLVLFIIWACSGDIAWWQAWVYSIIIFIVGVGGRMLAEWRHPGLLAERVKVGKTNDVKPWDKVLSPLMAISVGYPLYIVAGLDHRFGWSPVFPIWLNILGILFCMLGYAIAVWALVENRFFSSMVRIQKERGHAVCDSGPYQYVRHPGYAGNLLPLVGIVLALGSIWTLIPAAVAVIIAVVRTALEDRTLQAELPGYREYAQRVRYRLIPGIY